MIFVERVLTKEREILSRLFTVDNLTDREVDRLFDLYVAGLADEEGESYE